MANRTDWIEGVLRSRRRLFGGVPPEAGPKAAEEGGCGVVGFASTVPVRGRHIFEHSIQMHNRGNGKGGGIAAAGLEPADLGVDASTLHEDYMLQVALLDSSVRGELERTALESVYRIDQGCVIEPAADWRNLGLEVAPPLICRYFVRARPDVLERFADENRLELSDERTVEDEYVFQNSIRLNQRYYASLGEKRTFVVSHARNLLIFKIVGYAEQVVQYYGLEDLRARVWIAHQRYPTKGKVWHPGGAHPFIGLMDALVHNGDFANYQGVCTYLRQHGLAPQFLTDTEVAVLLFDLWSRVYGYPLEYVIEALAPTTELDFDRLPEEKKRLYKILQTQHIQGSPDGPWFFIIARSEPDEDRFRLLGITDTSMLRPQVFALQEGDVSIGLVASEKQAIDATLRSLSEEDRRFRPVADRYWNARGGSHTNGGAFLFTVQGPNGSCTLTCTDKFGRKIQSPPGEWRIQERLPAAEVSSGVGERILAGLRGASDRASVCREAFSDLVQVVVGEGLGGAVRLLGEIEKGALQSDEDLENALEILTLLYDRRYNCRGIRPRLVRELVSGAIDRILDAVPSIDGPGGGRFRRIDWRSREALRAPCSGERILFVCARDFPPEGPECAARLVVRAWEKGWRRFVIYSLKGQRFLGCGFSAREATASGSTCTAVQGITWPLALTAWRSMCMVMARTSSARS